MTSVLFVFAQFSSLFCYMILPLTTRLRSLLERWFPQKRVDMDGNGEARLASLNTPRAPSPHLYHEVRYDSLRSMSTQ